MLSKIIYGREIVGSVGFRGMPIFAMSTVQGLHKRSLDRSRELDLDVAQQYPFNTITLAHRSLLQIGPQTNSRKHRRGHSCDLWFRRCKDLQTGAGTNQPAGLPVIQQ